MSKLNDILDLQIELRNLIAPPNTDVSWSCFENVEDVLIAVDMLNQQLKLGEDEVISELKILNNLIEIVYTLAEIWLRTSSIDFIQLGSLSEVASNEALSLVRRHFQNFFH
ncbi:hypothetical protein BC351_26705 [Paenibacillus ferrarius]|uniref:Uncharacterized protein n=1 Tax=Paenibacillus ferrarius TaxID=1469647 RepID=A0A1V4HK75_9BACL|nr:hypothetical protein [Paenibacillus ferrarius]OPH57001.1 hypothetical protein BC351_26705 [Paenibacillus ferrarius]